MLIRATTNWESAWTKYFWSSKQACEVELHYHQCIDDRTGKRWMRLERWPEGLSSIIGPSWGTKKQKTGCCCPQGMCDLGQEQGCSGTEGNQQGHTVDCGLDYPTRSWGSKGMLVLWIEQVLNIGLLSCAELNLVKSQIKVIIDENMYSPKWNAGGVEE